jgi:hypothetical protein
VKQKAGIYTGFFALVGIQSHLIRQKGKTDMTAHAILSASASKRWLTCTPSARLEATLPDLRKPLGAFDYSAEGTTAHTLSELKLRHQFGKIGNEEYNEKYNELKKSAYYSEDFEANVDNYVVFVRSQIGEGDVPMFEQRVDFSDWVPDGFGTADVIILSRYKIRVIDLKFGRGLPVSAKDNSQLRLYALGAYAKFREEYPEVKEVEYTIHQPRLDSISTDWTSVEKLLDWANYFVKTKAKKAWVGTGEFVPSDACQFCRAKATCRARADFNNEVAKLDFRPAPLLNDDEIDLVLSRAGNIKTWITDVESFVTERAVLHDIIPKGYKLTTTKAHRKIGDEEMAVVVLTENGFKKEALFDAPKLKSVAQLEKIGQKGQVAGILGGLILSPDGAPKLVKDATLEEDFK